MIYVFALMFGLLIGSFLNVCIYRIPRKESIVFPASHCPHCQQPIKPWDNIPVLSYLILQGKCRGCQAPISWRYPLVEGLTGVLFAIIVYKFSFTIDALVYLIFACALLVVSCIDLDYRIIPDVISLPGILVGFIASFFLPLPWYHSLIGIVVGGGVILATGYIGEFFFKKEAMGGGDVKLMAMIGAFLGWKLALLTVFFASLTGAIIGIIMKLTVGEEYIPFGPFLSAGALLSLLFGETLLLWYWNLLTPPM